MKTKIDIRNVLLVLIGLLMLGGKVWGQTVTNTGGMSVIETYHGTTFDLSTLFVIDENAGLQKYSIESGSTGTGMIVGSNLTVTNCGIFYIGLTTAETDTHDAGALVTSTLTVDPAPIISVAITVTQPATGAVPNTTATGTGNFSCSAVTWTPNHNPFQGEKEYTAEVTLTANANYTFAGGLATATINGQDATVTTDGENAILTYIFDATEPKTVTGIAIKSQPSKLNYIDGDLLNLSGLVVTLTYNDGTTLDVLFNNFGTNNITTIPANNALLTVVPHNSSPVVVSCNGRSADTNHLTVIFPSYGISLTPSGLQTFSDAAFGYGAQNPLSVKVTNTGNSPTSNLVVALSGDHNNSFKLSTTSMSNIGPGSNSNFTVVPNTGLLCGTYTATVTVSGGSGITASLSVSFTVNKATPPYTVPTNLTATYNDLLSTVSLPAGWQWETPTDPVGDAGIRTHKATFTPSDLTNYNIVTGINVPVTVIGINVDLPKAATGLIYNGLERTGVVSGTGYTVENGTAVLKGDYIATVTLSPNYKWSDGDPAESRTIAWSIEARPLTIGTPAVSDKPYDGNHSATVSVPLNNIVGSDVVFAVISSATFANAHVGTHEVNISCTLGGTAAGNYTLPVPTTTSTGSITAKTLTYGTPITVQSKPYNGNNSAEIIGGIPLTGKVGSDDVYVEIGNAFFDNVNAGTHTVTIPCTLAGSTAGNYTLASPTASSTGVIMPKFITISPNDINYNGKTYDKTKDADGLTITLPGIIAPDVVTVTFSAQFDDANAGTRTVTVSGITLGGANAGNYSLTSTTAVKNNVTISKAQQIPLNITGLNSEYTYDIGSFPIGVTGGSTNGTVTYVSSKIGVATVDNTGLVTIITTGSFTITATMAGDNNYEDVSVTSYQVTIARAPGSGSVSIANWTYGETARNPFPVSATNGTSNVTYHYKIQGAGDDTYKSTIPTNAGNYTVRATFAATEYYFACTAIENFTISPKTINVTANAGQGKIYGDPEPKLTFTVEPSLIGSDAFSGALSRAAGENVATYTINQGTLSAGANYTIMFTGANFNITQKAITVTADYKEKIYGDLDPDLTYTLSPALSFNDKFTGALTRAAGMDAGTYPITQGNLSAGTNYTIKYNPADFVIKRKEVTVTARNETKTYGDDDPELRYSVSPPLINGDKFTGALSRTPGENVNDYAITKGTLANNNYTITVFNSAFLKITPKPITVTANADHRTYGDTELPLNKYSVNPSLKAGDRFTGALSRMPGNDVGTYPINIGTLSAGSNYTISFIPNNYSITKRQITFTASVDDRLYMEKNTSATVTAGSIKFFYLAYDESLVLGTDYFVIASFVDENAGNKDAYINVNLIITSAVASNYELISNQYITKANILKIPVTVPTAATGLVYNGSEQTGVVGGNHYSVSGGKGTNAGNYTATVTLNEPTNYKWSTGNETAPRIIYWSISKETVTVPTAVTGLVYNGSVQTGVSGGDGTLYTVQDGSKRNAGNYTATVQLIDPVNYKWSSTDESNNMLLINWSIAKAIEPIPAAIQGLVYNGLEQIGIPNGANYTVENGSGTDFGTYTARVTLNDTDNYRWPGLSNPNPFRDIEWIIARAIINEPKPVTGLVYNGSLQTGVSASEYYTVGNGSKTDAGDYTATVKLIDPVNYKWSSGSDSNDTRQVNWNIAKAIIPLPIPVSGLIYNGKEQIGVPENSKYYKVRNGNGTDADTYTAFATLNDIKNYKWESGLETNDTRTFIWNIAPKSITIFAAVADKTYDGKLTATVRPGSIKFDGLVPGETLVEEENYTFNAEFDDKNAGNDKPVKITVEIRNANYELASKTIGTKANIYQALLTFEAGVNEKPYDGNTTATVGTVVFDGLIGSEKLVLNTDYTASASFKDANAGIKKRATVTVTLLPASGIAKNYKLANDPVANQCDTTATILKIKQVAFKINNPGEQTYGVSLISLSYTGGSGTGEVTFEKKGPGTITGNLLTFTGKDTAGFVVVKAIKAADVNYEEISAEETIKVNKAALRVIANNQSIFAGTEIRSFKEFFTYYYVSEDFKFGHDSEILEDPVIIKCDFTSATPAGEKLPIYFKGGKNDPRYKFDPTDGELTVASPLKNIIYGKTEDLLSNFKGKIYSIDPPDIIEPVIINDTLYAKSLKRGTAYITFADNYLPSMTVTVLPATLLYGVKDAKRYQGEKNPEFEPYYISGLEYKDKIEDVVLEPPIVTCPGANELWADPKIYTFEFKGGQSKYNNYVFKYNELGTLEVLARLNLPTFFTPNGDDINDVWPRRNSGYTIKILNRLGVLIFSGEDEWDGTDNKGRRVQPDIYYYVVTPPKTETDPKPTPKRGTVELIRSQR